MNKKSVFFTVATVAIGVVCSGQASAVDSRKNPSTAGGAKVVKFETDYGYGKENFSVQVEDLGQLRIAEALLDGEGEVTTNVPSGLLVKAPSAANPGYDWHVDPKGFKFAEVGGDFCNAPPSEVKPGTEVWYWGAYCPRNVKVIFIASMN